MKKHLKTRFAALATAASLLIATPGFAFSENLSTGLGMSVHGSAEIVHGSLKAVQGAATFTVSSVVAAGEFVNIALNDMTDSVAIVVKASATGAQAASLVAGSVVEVVATASGHALMVAGEAIAFIPLTVADNLFRSTQQ